MQPGVQLPCSKEPAIEPYPKQRESIRHSHIIFLRHVSDQQSRNWWRFRNPLL
jgi:hypothetical protein